MEVLRPVYLQLPDKEGWIAIAEEFERVWQLSNCVGALDGRHQKVSAPPHSGSKCYNYKNFHSMVMMGLSDAYRRFIWLNVGDFGK